MNEPCISVVLPVFNGEAFLREALDSILAQTFQDLELILVDDFSTDGSQRIIREYALRDARVRLVANTQGKGLAGAVNSGVEAATGTFIARMDQDDISAPCRLRQQATFMQQNPEVGLCGTWFRFMRSGEVVRHPEQHDDIKVKLLGNTAFAHPTVMLRKSVLMAHNLRYDRTFEPADDYHLWVRLVQITRLANIPEILLDYREHAGQISQTALRIQATQANSIRLLQAHALGLKFTPAEEATYLALVTGVPPAPDQLALAGNLSSRVLAAAQRSGAYNMDKLAAFLNKTLAAAQVQPAAASGNWYHRLKAKLKVFHA